MPHRTTFYTRCRLGSLPVPPLRLDSTLHCLCSTQHHTHTVWLHSCSAFCYARFTTVGLGLPFRLPTYGYRYAFTLPVVTVTLRFTVHLSSFLYWLRLLVRSALHMVLRLPPGLHAHTTPFTRYVTLPFRIYYTVGSRLLVVILRGFLLPLRSPPCGCCRGLHTATAHTVVACGCTRCLLPVTVGFTFTFWIGCSLFTTARSDYRLFTVPHHAAGSSCLPHTTLLVLVLRMPYGSLPYTFWFCHMVVGSAAVPVYTVLVTAVLARFTSSRTVHCLYGYGCSAFGSHGYAVWFTRTFACGLLHRLHLTGLRFFVPRTTRHGCSLRYGYGLVTHALRFYTLPPRLHIRTFPLRVPPHAVCALRYAFYVLAVLTYAHRYTYIHGLPHGSAFYTRYIWFVLPSPHITPLHTVPLRVLRFHSSSTAYGSYGSYLWVLRLLRFAGYGCRAPATALPRLPVTLPVAVYAHLRSYVWLGYRLHGLQFTYAVASHTVTCVRFTVTTGFGWIAVTFVPHRSTLPAVGLQFTFVVTYTVTLPVLVAVTFPDCSFGLHVCRTRTFARLPRFLLQFPLCRTRYAPLLRILRTLPYARSALIATFVPLLHRSRPPPPCGYTRRFTTFCRGSCRLLVPRLVALPHSRFAHTVWVTFYVGYVPACHRTPFTHTVYTHGLRFLPLRRLVTTCSACVWFCWFTFCVPCPVFTCCGSTLPTMPHTAHLPCCITFPVHRLLRHLAVLAHLRGLRLPAFGSRSLWLRLILPAVVAGSAWFAPHVLHTRFAARVPLFDFAARTRVTPLPTAHGSYGYTVAYRLRLRLRFATVPPAVAMQFACFVTRSTVACYGSHSAFCRCSSQFVLTHPRLRLDCLPLRLRHTTLPRSARLVTVLRTRTLLHARPVHLLRLPAVAHHFTAVLACSSFTRFTMPPYRFFGSVLAHTRLPHCCYTVLLLVTCTVTRLRRLRTVLPVLRTTALV